MRILIFNWRDIRNPNAGGAEIFTHENAKRWVRQGNEVTLLTSMFPGGMSEETLDGIHIHRSGGRFSVYLKTKKMYNQFCKGKFDLVIDEINTRPFFTLDYVHEPIIAFNRLKIKYFLSRLFHYLQQAQIIPKKSPLLKE